LKSGSLNLLQPSEPVQACAAIADLTRYSRELKIDSDSSRCQGLYTEHS